MDVGDWLRGLGLEQYEPAFRENRIGADLVPSLTADDLKDLGICLVGDRRRLLDAIAALRAGALAGVPPAVSSTSAAASPDHHRLAETGAERRHLTVMFCDLVGSTALSTRLDVEDLR